MKVQLILYASLAHLMPAESVDSGGALDVSAGSTVRDLIDRLEIPVESAKVIFLNGRHAKYDQVLRDGDRVAVFPPVAGG
jgi:molybdopterin synthase sulfur carrier subunit